MPEHTGQVVKVSKFSANFYKCFTWNKESFLSAEPIMNCEFCIMNYFMYTKSTEISAGETPLIRDACPIVEGRTLDNF